MSAAQQAPGPTAALEVSLRIGQRVRHQDFKGKRVTGIVRGLSVDSDDVLHADIALDDAIVIPPRNENDSELRLYHQYVPAHELAPFDEREEMLAGMLTELRAARSYIQASRDNLSDCHRNPVSGKLHPANVCDEDNALLARIDAVIAKATGAAS